MIIQIPMRIFIGWLDKQVAMNGQNRLNGGCVLIKIGLGLLRPDLIIELSG